MPKHYNRAFEKQLYSSLKAKPQFIQIVLGPRQVGKTTGTLNVLNKQFSKKDYHYYECEEALFEKEWLRQKIQQILEDKPKIVVFDEIQKVPYWSELIKLGWDKTKKQKLNIHWVLLGSSSLDLTIGLNESLSGRFEIIPVHHWSFYESQKSYSLTWNDYLTCGGYPGSYTLLKDKVKFFKYIYNSLFETTISKDIFRHTTIKKPALFKQVFQKSCQFTGKEVSYNKLLGQLTEAGNVDQIKHYLELFEKAFLLRLIFKKNKRNLNKNSSPKIIVLAPAFTTLFKSNNNPSKEDLGAVFESIVGARLCECLNKVLYWRKGNDEMDYVVEIDDQTIGIEVKSNILKATNIKNFKKEFPGSVVCVINFTNYLKFEKNPIKFLTQNSF